MNTHDTDDFLMENEHHFHLLAISCIIQENISSIMLFAAVQTIPAQHPCPSPLLFKYIKHFFFPPEIGLLLLLPSTVTLKMLVIFKSILILVLIP